MNDIEKILDIFNHPITLYILSLFGMLTHYIKKKIRNDSIIALVEYIKLHTLSFFTSMGATTVLFMTFLATLQTGQPLDYVAVFTIGYTSDSFFNKYDTATSEKENKENLNGREQASNLGGN